MRDTEIIQLIADRKEGKAFQKLYGVRKKIQSLVYKFNGSKQDADDVLQDALIILCKKVWAGNFKLTSSLDTYLYAVCFNICRRKYGKSIKNVALGHDVEATEEIDAAIEKEEKLNKIEHALTQIGKACMQLLQSFYYEKLSLKEIAPKLGYSSVNSAKVQKFKCLERAKKLVNKL